MGKVFNLPPRSPWAEKFIITCMLGAASCYESYAGCPPNRLAAPLPVPSFCLPGGGGGWGGGVTIWVIGVKTTKTEPPSRSERLKDEQDKQKFFSRLNIFFTYWNICANDKLKHCRWQHITRHTCLKGPDMSKYDHFSGNQRKYSAVRMKGNLDVWWRFSLLEEIRISIITSYPTAAGYRVIADAWRTFRSFEEAPRDSKS